MMEDCIFCKIAKGEIPCAKVYEDDKVLAFLDIAPVSKGHTIVIPKEHHKDLLDVPNELLEHIIIAVKKISKAVVRAVDADGFNIGKNNGSAAGQVVMHSHFHIIPRFEGDGLKPWPQGEYEEGEMDKIARDINSVI